MWPIIIISLGIRLVCMVKSECGRPAIAPDTSRIVGGRDVVPGSWPWQGLFMHRWGWYSPSQYICGGSLVSPNWFMTAAHCIYGGDNDPSNYKVVLGAYNRIFPESSKQTIGAKSVLRYSQYNVSSFAYDIALVELERPADIGERVSPVCLPKSDSDALSTGNSVIVTGWGSTATNGFASSTLKQVRVPIVPFRTCNSVNEYDGLIKEDCMFCAGIEGKDSCQGDSGGPVVSQDSSGRWFQYGIVSFGVVDGCALPQFPGVYSRVTDYCQFIKDTTGLDLCM